MNNQNLHAALSTLFLFILLSLFSVKGYTQTKGCTDPLATNYNASAFMNDGSCVYSPASVNAVSSTQLPTQMKGTSGLIWMNNKLWTQNNFSDINLYAFDPAQVNSFQTLSLTGTVNIDWEEMTQDGEYLYIGDFGNNVNGNRTNLQILRIKKTTLFQASLQIDTIKFSYITQTNFTPTGANKTNYDCEAFVVTQDSIYLFTKEWLTNKTSLYRLPKTPGTYSASLVTVLDVQGLITGAMLLESKRLLVLCGYNSTLQPFVYLLYDYSGARFFEGNKRKLNLNLAFHQVEAITTQDGLNYHITNESFSQFGMTVPQKLHQLNLGTYLSGYLSVTNTQDHFVRNAFNVYPVPAKNFIQIDLKSALHRLPYSIVDSRGSVVQQGVWTKEMNRLEVDRLSSGLYWVILSGEKTYVKQWVKE
jgi:hypothetical protein